MLSICNQLTYFIEFALHNKVNAEFPISFETLPKNIVELVIVLHVPFATSLYYDYDGRSLLAKPVPQHTNHIFCCLGRFVSACI